jgi:3',5'-cyclic AMP phosphodiesterase CpdA
LFSDNFWCEEGTMPTITWLHLSDLHFRADELHAWNEDIVLRALLRDVRECMEGDEGLRPDLVVVTGDVAFSGKPQEYDLARAFLDDLLAVTTLGKDRLFLVPGNHDVDRGRISRGARGIAASLTDRGSANAVLADAGDRGLMLARFHGYREFVNGYLGPHLTFGDEALDGEGYFYVRNLKLAGQRIAVLGLNSAWLAQGGDEDRGRLALGERQMRAALDAAADADLRIAAMHHPFDWLRDFDRADAEALLCAGCDFVLHGHMHQVGLLQTRTPDSDAFVVAAGACYETREHPNAYNYVQVDLGTGQGVVHLRNYSDRGGGFWTKDVVNYRNVPDGVYRFSLAGRDARAPREPSRRGDRGQVVRATHGGAAAAGRGVAQTGNGGIAITGDIQGGVTIVQGGQAPGTAPPAPADTGGYDSSSASGPDLGAVRDLLLAAFSADELRRLFLYTSNDELRALPREFGSSDGLAAMVEKTIQFCLARALLPDLLGEVERANPRQYARHAHRLRL